MRRPVLWGLSCYALGAATALLIVWAIARP